MKRFLFGVLTAILICVFCFPTWADSQKFAIQTVRVDDNGKVDTVIYDPQEGQLEVKDFSMLMDQTTIPIESVSSLQNADIGTTWIFVVDLSVLEAGKNLEKTKAILNGILVGDGAALGPKDKAGIFTTGMAAKDILLTDDRKVLRIQIDTIMPDPQSKQLYAKTVEALNYLETGKDVQERRVLVLISNGVNETIAGSLYEELTSHFQDTKTTVYTFALMMNTDKNSTERFNSLARYSLGGMYYILTPSYDDQGDTQVQSLISNEKRFRCVSANPGGEGIKGETVSISKTENPNEIDTIELTKVQQAQLSEAADAAIVAKSTPTPGPETPSPEPAPKETEPVPPPPEPQVLSPIQIGLIAAAAILVITFIVLIVKKNSKKHLDDPVSSAYDSLGEKTEPAPLVSTVTTLMVKLESVGVDEAKTYTSPMVDELVIGRVPNKARLIIPDSKVSGANSKLSYENKVMFIEDLGSTNGTQLNGMKVTGRIVVHQQDIIRIGQSNLRISWEKAK